MLLTPSATAVGFRSVAKTKITALDAYAQAVNQGNRKLAPCRSIYLLYGRSCDLHIRCTFFLRKALFVDQTYALVFIYVQNDKFTVFSLRQKFSEARQGANLSASFGSCHLHSFHSDKIREHQSDICHLLSTIISPMTKKVNGFLKKYPLRLLTDNHRVYLIK